MPAISTKTRAFGIQERVMRARDGRLFIVRFAVGEIGGVLRGRVLSVTPVSAIAGKTTKAAAKSGVVCLPTGAKTAFSREDTRPVSVESPFVSSLEFFVSQMTRAPSFRI